MAVIFLGFFITGIGTSFFYSFGIPYIGAIFSESEELFEISNCLEYAILSVTKMTDPSFSNALLYWMFRDQ